MSLQGFEGELRVWDVAFWAERLREERYAITDEQLRPYFALPSVLEGLFKVCLPARYLFIKNICISNDTIEIYWLLFFWNEHSLLGSRAPMSSALAAACMQVPHALLLCRTSCAHGSKDRWLWGSYAQKGGTAHPLHRWLTQQAGPAC